MTMEKEEVGGFGGLGLIILLFLLFIMFSGNVFGRGNTIEGCSARTNCEIEKQGIVDAARNYVVTTQTAADTQKLVIQEEALTRSTVTADGNLTRQKIDFYAYENLKDQLAQARDRNMVLENRVYSDAQFNSLKMENAEIMCSLKRLPRTAPIYATGVSACGEPFPTQGCGGIV